MKSIVVLPLLMLSFSAVQILSQTAALADQFVYVTQCMPTESEDIARVVRGNIWLALRADKTIRKSELDVRIRTDESPKQWTTESELLDHTGFLFDPSDLSISLGGKVSGHACYAPARLLINISVKRKDGTSVANNVVIPIQVPGAYATQGKYIESEGLSH